MREEGLIPRQDTECEHDFDLVLGGVSELTEEMVDAIFEAGCDDATPSLRSGRVFLKFTRRAPSLKDAVIEAICQVRRANIGATVLHVDDCNLVTPSDIARKTQRSRQRVHQWIQEASGSFPAPVCDLGEEHPLWAWCEVSQWLWERGFINERMAQDASEVAYINTVLDYYRYLNIDPALFETIFQRLGRIDQGRCEPQPSTSDTP